MRTAFRKSVLNALYVTGLHRVIAPLAQGIGTVLMFHHVRPQRSGAFRPNAHLEVTPEFLRAVVLRLRALDIDIVDLDEVARRLAAGETHRRFAAITFDDGYRNNLVHAYPVLKALGAPFAIYVATGLVDRVAIPWWEVLEAAIEGSDRLAGTIGDEAIDLPARSLAEKARAFRLAINRLNEAGQDEQRVAIARIARDHGVDIAAMLDGEMMDWQEVRGLAADPLVTIGAHTVGHYALCRLPPERARAEMAASRERIAAMTGAAPRHFAYPYGSVLSAGEREFDLAAELGFTTAVTTRPGMLGADAALRPTALPRLSVNGHYQSVRYLDVLLSGVPFLAHRALTRARGVSPSRASASTR